MGPVLSRTPLRRAGFGNPERFGQPWRDSDDIKPKFALSKVISKTLSPGGFHSEKLTARRIFKLNHLCHFSGVKYLKNPRTILILQCSSSVGKLCLRRTNFQGGVEKNQSKSHSSD